MVARATTTAAGERRANAELTGRRCLPSLHDRHRIVIRTNPVTIEFDYGI
jgi:hypothetical protein